ncbi:MAG: sigma-54-dependent transcriptional regulator [Candidatus Helarchaeota archaeon]
MLKILAIDDDPSFLLSLSNFLEYKNYYVQTAPNPFKAEEYFRNEDFDCVLLDVKMPGMDGIDLLKKFQQIRPTIPIIMISGQSTISTAVEAIKLGAYDFIEKPLDIDRLLITLKNALEKKIWQSEKLSLLSQIDDAYPFIAVSKKMRDLIEKIKRIAPTDTKVLILGESGTGKELIARALHYHSKRNTKPFIKINCAAIPTELLESELFGHKKGSFTGATSDYKGKFLAADTGTLFLDEIGDMEEKLQAKLLRVLQDGEVEIIGETKPRKVDVRIIAATNKDLTKLVNERKFREDLYHRLNVVQIRIPPLREHVEDIPVLARYFLKEFAQTYNKKLVDFTPQAMHLLINYSWPGNVRELRNVVEKISVLTKNTRITAAEVSEALEPENNLSTVKAYSGTLQEAREKFEKEYIKRFLNITGWKIQETAEALGINRSALFKKMRKLGIKKPNS